MKITKSQLKRIIKEELESVLTEADPCGPKPALTRADMQTAKTGNPNANVIARRKWLKCKKQGSKQKGTGGADTLRGKMDPKHYKAAAAAFGKKKVDGCFKRGDYAVGPLGVQRAMVSGKISAEAATWWLSQECYTDNPDWVKKVVDEGIEALKEAIASLKEVLPKDAVPHPRKANVWISPHDRIKGYMRLFYIGGQEDLDPAAIKAQGLSLDDLKAKKPTGPAAAKPGAPAAKPGAAAAKPGAAAPAAPAGGGEIQPGMEWADVANVLKQAGHNPNKKIAWNKVDPNLRQQYKNWWKTRKKE